MSASGATVGVAHNARRPRVVGYPHGADPGVGESTSTANLPTSSTTPTPQPTDAFILPGRGPVGDEPNQLRRGLLIVVRCCAARYKLLQIASLLTVGLPLQACDQHF
jgi:hypothetical protein